MVQHPYLSRHPTVVLLRITSLEKPLGLARLDEASGVHSHMPRFDLELFLIGSHQEALFGRGGRWWVSGRSFLNFSELGSFWKKCISGVGSGKRYPSLLLAMFSASRQSCLFLFVFLK